MIVLFKPALGLLNLAIIIEPADRHRFNPCFYRTTFRGYLLPKTVSFLAVYKKYVLKKETKYILKKPFF